MKHDQLKTIIKHFTPTLLDVVKPASSDEIAKLEALAGPLPQSYREFLELMGNFCPFVSHQVFLYSPEGLLEGFEHEIPEGFLLIGRDTTGSTFDLYIRHKDRVVLRLSKYYEPITNEDFLYESHNFESYLLSIYVPQILVRSLPFHTASVLSGTDEEIQDFQNKVDEVCKDFNITHSVVMPDFRFMEDMIL